MPTWCIQFVTVVLIAVTCCAPAPFVRSQDIPGLATGDKSAPDKKPRTTTPEKVDVEPAAADNDIAARLQRILDATGWFTDASVRVEEGVVFLSGTAKNGEIKEWAGNLARRTQDVVAVVNQLDLEQPSIWNLDPASQGLRELWIDSLSMLPFVLFGMVILFMSRIAARLSAVGTRKFLTRRIASTLLRDVLARAVGLLVFLFGIYIVLRVAGLTRLALTVLGGTGILGLVIGIAFRDITENFLASIFLSMRRPYLIGDLVEIVGILGYVQKLTTRATMLMTLDGNHVEIPNSTVYKNTIRNFSTNKNRRADFTVGIGYDVSIAQAQEVALQVLRNHPAVLKDPEPWALVESLGSAVVVLRIYFWIDGSEHSWLKVKSSTIRMIKRAFQEAEISMPDEARELVFPQGVPVRLLGDGSTADTALQPATDMRQPKEPLPIEPLPVEPLSTSAEGGLRSDADEIEGQARQSRELEGENLLASPSDSAAAR